MFSVPISAIVVCSLAADPSGLRARGNAADYPRHAAENLVSIGAEMLGAQEVKNTFATDLNRGFLVVEVGVYPPDGKTWNLNPDDFSLRIGADKVVRPSTPSTVASVLQRKAKDRSAARGGSGPGDIMVYPSATIGYESVSSGTIDPATGRARRGGGGGWVTGGGVGVGMGGNNGPMPQGGPAPGASDVDRSTMQTELWDKSLPEGEIKAPVAGYLYFPMPEEMKKKGPAAGKAFELIMQNPDTKIRLALAPPAK
jgi:hypothetical protein